MTATHPLVRLETLALIAVGAFAGAILRFLAMGLGSDVRAILAVNALGSAALGFIVYEAEYAGLLGRRSRLFLSTGLLSSLTTYSTFAIQTALAADPVVLAAIVAGNYGFGFAGVLAGRTVARRLGAVFEPGTGGETA
ncbi:Camphor resistance CrcB protein [Haloterrigena turkmenica DSM 5511]|uniref:Fluoride-specific ion channel FluC n=1 Tax=Haloterrigena turkmenica (strain ATCC 51198 / DSM 5511 / JCM 9101 / NCIMB 13204 / VKM B-1734 / 4k) TaxID=543526 RepID=D2RUY0_HALTV|nr:CrcB family protein [Haloterrigena turkmenica]ADB59273.1 Camphor resistance CrcB protein [Haloterrigena turkmenica DSM 5511]